MKILIAEKSFQIRKRIIKLLSCIKEIETISIRGTYEELVKHLSLSAFEIVIADISVFGTSVLKDINTVKDEYKRLYKYDKISFFRKTISSR